MSIAALRLINTDTKQNTSAGETKSGEIRQAERREDDK